ncbi:MAG: SDR family oxidoreductase [Calditrichaeota bacterium]|nr:MAG: SDR family oxidoreductase [Calditrichota bacterium]
MKNSNKYLEDLKGKICVVTGGGGMIGTAIAIELAHLEAEVAILDYKQERCDACAQKLSEKVGKDVTCIVADVLNEEMLRASNDHINNKLGKIDILINCAGGNSLEGTTELEFLSSENLDELEKSFFGLTIDGFRSVFDLNLLGTVLPTMIFSRDMVGRGGAILNVSSMSGFRPLTKVAAYSAAKASINNFTQWLAVHLARAGIRVNAIAPGFFLTTQNEYLLKDKDTGELTERASKIISNTPMERFGDLEDLLGGVLYLISDMSRFVTGTVLPIDGGFGIFSGV